MSNKILIIDDDVELITSLTLYFQREGFEVFNAQDGETGIKMALNITFDAIIVEVMLPKVNGFDVVKTIREHSQVCLLILSGRSNEIDVIIGFECGADDYLIKPCSPQELLMRLQSILKRGQNNSMHRPTIAQNDITVDCAKRTASISGTCLELTNAEFNILEMLIKSPGQAFSKEELTEYALGRKYTAYDRSIDVHISNLRNKLGNNVHGESILKTVRGFGYMFNVGTSL